MINDNNINELINKVNDTNEPIILTNNNNNKKAVLLSEFEYNSIMETIYLNSIPGFAESILKSSKEPIEECIPYNANKF